MRATLLRRPEPGVMIVAPLLARCINAPPLCLDCRHVRRARARDRHCRAARSVSQRSGGSLPASGRAHRLASSWQLRAARACRYPRRRYGFARRASARRSSGAAGVHDHVPLLSCLSSRLEVTRRTCRQPRERGQIRPARHWPLPRFDRADRCIQAEAPAAVSDHCFRFPPRPGALPDPIGAAHPRYRLRKSHNVLPDGGAHH